MRKIGIFAAALLLYGACGSTTIIVPSGKQEKPDSGTTQVPWDDTGNLFPGSDGTSVDAVPADTGTCQDGDGDGFGPGCPAGADCDDANPNFGAVCPPCQPGPVPGCACDQIQPPQPCYAGPDATAGVGVCQKGLHSCGPDGYWGPCQGETLPQAELCDGLDNDCNGVTDEGVLSPCGNCDLECHGFDTGAGTSQPFAPDDSNSEGVGLTPEGWLILDSTKIDLNLIWVANSAESTVSKLDTTTGRELGRYVTCSDPSRTAVDLMGDVWVACRGDGGVAKIRAHESACSDKNSNGIKETSRDLDGNGVISGDEMLPPGQDECIEFLVFPGGGLQRAAGVDKENHVWIGDWNGSRLLRLSPVDGHLVQEISIPAKPYGLVIDSAGTIWVSGRGGSKIIKVVPTTGTVTSVGNMDPYGITLDYKGRVWVANYGDSPVAKRFTPSTGEWHSVTTHLNPRGIAGAANGLVYVANDSDDSVAVVDSDQMTVIGQIDLGNGRFPVGMAVDFQGFVWAVNQGTSTVTKIDSATQSVVGEYPVGQGPYTYSDMTGYTLHTFTAPQGHYLFTVQATPTTGGSTHAGPDILVWTSVDIDADTPPGTSIKFEVRAGDSLEDAAAKPWSAALGPFPPAAFPFPLDSVGPVTGLVLQVRVWLYSDGQNSTPTVKQVNASFELE